MIFQTASGSMYEVDGLRARRLFGTTRPTERIGSDMAWRALDVAPRVEVHKSVIFQWTDAIEPAAVEGAIPATVTSAVVEILEP